MHTAYGTYAGQLVLVQWWPSQQQRVFPSVKGVVGTPRCAAWLPSPGTGINQQLQPVWKSRCAVSEGTSMTAVNWLVSSGISRHSPHHLHEYKRSTLFTHAKWSGRSVAPFSCASVNPFSASALLSARLASCDTVRQQPQHNKVKHTVQALPLAVVAKCSASCSSCTSTALRQLQTQHAMCMHKAQPCTSVNYPLTSPDFITGGFPSKTYLPMTKCMQVVTDQMKQIDGSMDSHWLDSILHHSNGAIEEPHYMTTHKESNTSYHHYTTNLPGYRHIGEGKRGRGTTHI